MNNKMDGSNGDINKNSEIKSLEIKTNNFSKAATATFNLLEVAIITFMVTLTTILITSVVVKYSIKKEQKINATLDNDLKEVENMYYNILENYYSDVDKETLIKGAISGMLDAVGDPYTTLLDENQTNTVDVMLEGSYEGVGIVVSNDNDKNIFITNILEGSSAYKSGLKVMDEIIEINGKKFKGQSTSELTKYIESLGKNSIKIKVIRDNKEMEFTVTRSLIEIKSVDSKVYEENSKKIGYIYINLFAKNTDKQFIDALDKLENEKIDSLIIDLRNNTGGHLTSVSNIISSLISKEYIMYNIETNNVKVPYYSKGTNTKQYPIVLLVNNESASASEVLAGSLRDNLKSVLIGTTTYGKGTVQKLNSLTTGDYYKLTTQKWLTPNGTWVHKIGLTPDIEVELSSSYDGTDRNDNQLQKAIEYLSANIE